MCSSDLVGGVEHVFTRYSYYRRLRHNGNTVTHPLRTLAVLDDLLATAGVDAERLGWREETPRGSLGAPLISFSQRTRKQVEETYKFCARSDTLNKH